MARDGLALGLEVQAAIGLQAGRDICSSSRWPAKASSNSTARRPGGGESGHQAIKL